MILWFLIRSSKKSTIDPVNKESVAEAIDSGARMTDRVDLSKVNPKIRK